MTVVPDDHGVDPTEVIKLELDMHFGGVSVQAVPHQLFHGTQRIRASSHFLDEVGTYLYRNPHE